jgi:hypothetical protein
MVIHTLKNYARILALVSFWSAWVLVENLVLLLAFVQFPPARVLIRLGRIGVFFALEPKADPIYGRIVLTPASFSTIRKAPPVIMRPLGEAFETRGVVGEYPCVVFSRFADEAFARHLATSKKRGKRCVRGVQARPR